jgi:hypothetical protein
MLVDVSDDALGRIALGSRDREAIFVLARTALRSPCQRPRNQAVQAYPYAGLWSWHCEGRSWQADPSAPELPGPALLT